MTPLVLLPGMMCDARLFGPQIEALSSVRPLHLATITDHDTMEALATEVLANAPPRFALAGLSMGGIVAMDVLRQAPERVDRIALLDTNPKAEAEVIRQARAPQIARAQVGDLRAVMRDELMPYYLADGPDRRPILDLCMDMAEALGPDVFVRQSRALQSRPDQQETLRGVTVPTLVLCGEEDRLCPLHRHELMHALMPGSRLEVIAGAGHLPTLEKPAETSAALLEWLRS